MLLFCRLFGVTGAADAKQNDRKKTKKKKESAGDGCTAGALLVAALISSAPRKQSSPLITNGLPNKGTAYSNRKIKQYSYTNENRRGVSSVQIEH